MISIKMCIYIYLGFIRSDQYGESWWSNELEFRLLLIN